MLKDYFHTCEILEQQFEKLMMARLEAFLDILFYFQGWSLAASRWIPTSFHREYWEKDSGDIQEAEVTPLGDK